MACLVAVDWVAALVIALFSIHVAIDHRQKCART